MKGLVVDCSVTAAWCLCDENSAAADRALGEVMVRGGVAPGLWAVEMANSRVVAQRRGRIASADAEPAVDVLGRRPIAIAPTDAATMRRTRTMAREQGLTAHDGRDLDLAIRRALPLATFDGALRRAADRAGVDVEV